MNSVFSVLSVVEKLKNKILPQRAQRPLGFKGVFLIERP